MWNNFKEKVLMGAQENKLQKCFSQNEILRMMIFLCVFFRFPWNLKFIFSGFHKEFFLVSLLIPTGVITPLAIEKCKKNAIWPKIFWYKVFVHRKLKLLNLLMDSILIYLFSLILFWLFLGAAPSLHGWFYLHLWWCISTTTVYRHGEQNNAKLRLWCQHSHPIQISKKIRKGKRIFHHPKKYLRCIYHNEKNKIY